MTTKRAMRILALVATGGVVLQAAGCASTFAPLLLSVAESVILGTLTGGAVGGL